ncbi:hypothetical protein [Bosea sp. UNC402CLCol]|uniref:hypothetical protein n=1 Tax=Bosea sp. UNC402CLCol TaxID=1510531 RepID=UPI0012E0BD8A|nr:hypothetical protein [Bosea sp. UNC402CLCol]
MLFGLSAKDKLATDAACHTSRHLDDPFNAGLEAISLTLTSRKPHSASIRSTVNSCAIIVFQIGRLRTLKVGSGSYATLVSRLIVVTVGRSEGIAA